MDSCSNSLTLRENTRSANFNVDCPHVDPALTVLTQRTVACAKRRCRDAVVLVFFSDNEAYSSPPNMKKQFKNFAASRRCQNKTSREPSAPRPYL